MSSWRYKSDCLYDSALLWNPSNFCIWRRDKFVFLFRLISPVFLIRGLMFPYIAFFSWLCASFEKAERNSSSSSTSCCVTKIDRKIRKWGICQFSSIRGRLFPSSVGCLLVCGWTLIWFATVTLNLFSKLFSDRKTIPNFVVKVNSASLNSSEGLNVEWLLWKG